MKILNESESLLVIIDMQEKLLNAVYDKNIENEAEKISKAADILNIPAIITEQYPKGLGVTSDKIKTALPYAHFVEKNYFSACADESFDNILSNIDAAQIVLFGIETHICVLQTAFDILNKGYELFIVESACGSRFEPDKLSALKRLEKAGAQILTTEQVIFEWLRTSKHESFKQIQTLIK